MRHRIVHLNRVARGDSVHAGEGSDVAGGKKW